MDILRTQPLPFDANQVTPGVVGFAATVLVAVAVMLLMWDFNRRVRRINDRAHIKERIEAELAEREAQEAAAGRAAAGDAATGASPAPSSPDTASDDAP
ncbi:hypothetical protein [Agrococcus jenensis]|uniref:Uncharacterized protein n=1 Tax=Agrococcus jenensis TaxID=46353 RepID=A0A3N2AQ43_9MICO|nr:hypothetical protein [Agrococcus jenensis]ROR64832.1 hypothetical protein EDD26_0183 [Agrococcus jenensis]